MSQFESQEQARQRNLRDGINGGQGFDVGLNRDRHMEHGQQRTLGKTLRRTRFRLGQEGVTFDRSPYLANTKMVGKLVNLVNRQDEQHHQAEQTSHQRHK